MLTFDVKKNTNTKIHNYLLHVIPVVRSNRRNPATRARAVLAREMSDPKLPDE